MTRKLYHGTSKTAAALKIMDEGLRPQSHSAMGRTGRAALHPVENMTYLSPSLRYAAIYALGGSFLGNTLPDRMLGDETTGYLFVVSDDNLNLQPDEDEIGQAARSAYALVEKGATYFHQDMDSAIFAENYTKNPILARELYFLAKRVLTPIQQQKLFHDYRYDILAIAGKKLLKAMSPSMKQHFVELGCHVACSNEVIDPEEVWSIDKSRSKELDFHASNFFEIAKRIR